MDVGNHGLRVILFDVTVTYNYREVGVNIANLEKDVKKLLDDEREIKNSIH